MGKVLGLGTGTRWVQGGRQERDGSSDVDREGSNLRVEAGRERLSGRNRQRRVARPEALGQTPARAVSSGRRQDVFRHNAKTASEHLAPFPVAQRHFPNSPVKRNGARSPMAIGPRRQNMHYRVYAPVVADVHASAAQINKMSWRSHRFPQDLPKMVRDCGGRAAALYLQSGGACQTRWLISRRLPSGSST